MSEMFRRITTGGKEYVWENIVNGDVPEAAHVRDGTYTVTVSGEDFDGASVEVQFGRTADTVASVDATNLTFDENNSYNVEISQGFVQPVLTGGGAGTNINVYLTPIVRTGR